MLNFLRYPLKLHSTCRQKQVCHFCRASLLFKHFSAIAQRAASLKNTDKSCINNIFRLSWRLPAIRVPNHQVQGNISIPGPQHWDKTLSWGKLWMTSSWVRPSLQPFGPAAVAPPEVRSHPWGTTRYSPWQCWPGGRRQGRTHLPTSPPPAPSCRPLTLPGTLPGGTTRLCDHCPPNRHTFSYPTALLGPVCANCCRSGIQKEKEGEMDWLVKPTQSCQGSDWLIPLHLL